MQCAECGESLTDRTIQSDGVVKCPKCGHAASPSELIQTLWADAITMVDRPDVTIKAGVTRDDAADTASSATFTISDRISLRPQALGEAGSNVTPPPHYQLLQQLGEGGMGIVYRAHQTSTDRTIALKLIKGQYQADKRHKKGFLSEAIATANLDHPNIVPVYDVGSQEDGTVFYAMKEVRGTEWKAVITEKSLNENLDILMRVADAVAFAHSKGVIHRDLKPENVMLGDFGEVLVMDWGLAVSVTDEGKADRLDPEYAIGGTPCYMPPEMACGDAEKIGTASDVYLLGAILYEIATGKKAHAGATVTECLINAAENVIQESGQTGELVDIAMNAMATEPGERCGSVSELQAAMRDVVAHNESRSLVETGREHLRDAEKTGDYKDYARAVFAFEEALRLWPANKKATSSLSDASLVYAEHALSKGDLDLAASLLDEDSRAQKDLLSEVKKTVAARRARQKRLKLLTGLSIAAGVFIVVGAVVAAVWINAERQAVVDEQRKTAAERDKALEAQQAEAKQRRLAATQRDRANFALYRYCIAEADRLSKLGKYDQAREILNNAHPDCQGWEYGHLSCRMQRRTFRLIFERQGSGEVAFSPDGKRLASTSGDNKDRSIKLWDTSTGEELLTLQGHEDSLGLSPLSFSPDGKRLASADNRDSTVKLWDASTGKELLTLQGHTGAVSSVSFSPDGKRLASGSYDKTIKIWDTSTGEELLTLHGHTGGITSMSFSPDGKRLASASRGEGGIRLWEISTGKFLTKWFHVRMGQVESVRFSPDGKRLATGGHDNVVRLFDTSTGKELLTLQGHASSVTSFSFSPDGKRLASGSLDKTIKLWDTSTGKELLTLQGHARSVSSVSFSPDGKRLASGSWDRTIKLWDTSTREEVLAFPESGGGVTSLSFSPDGKRLASASGNGENIKLWDSSTGKELLTLQGRRPGVSPGIHSPGGQVAFSSDGKRLAAAGKKDSTITLWDSSTGKELLTLQGHTGTVISVSFSPDGKRLASGSWDRTIKLWDTSTGKELLTIEGHTRGFGNFVSFSPDGKRLASASGGGNIKLWDSSTGKELLTLPMYAGGAKSASFSPDGKRLASRSRDTIKIWDSSTGKELLTLRGHESIITSASFSPDGKRLASGSYDKTIKLWDTNTGKELLTLQGHEKPVTAVCFSPDGKRLASASYDNTIKLWETSSAKPEGMKEIKPVQTAPSQAKGGRALEIIVTEGIRTGASEIRLTYTGDAVTLVYIIDGKKKAHPAPPLDLAPDTVASAKQAADLDVTQLSIAQRGKSPVVKALGKEFNVWVTTEPIKGGERLTMRLVSVEDGS